VRVSDEALVAGMASSDHEAAAAFVRQRLRWQDNAGTETGTRIERCTGVGCTNFVEIATVGTNVTEHVDSDASTLPKASCRITAPEGDAFDMELAPRNEFGSTPTEIAKLFFYVASSVNAIPPGRYKAEARLPDELSGDHSESHSEIPAR
jgi:hypothetical protein